MSTNYIECFSIFLDTVGNNVFINNQRKKDFIAVEGWQKFFVPIDLEDVNIDELKEVLELQS